MCAELKPPQKYNVAPLIPLFSTKPFQLVTMDVMGPVKKSVRGNKYMLVNVDQYSKWVDIFPMPDQEAKTVAEKFVYFVADHGVPESVLTDQGTNFQSQFMEELYEILDIHKLRTTAYHPEGDGQSERLNRVIQIILASYVDENESNWDLFIPLVKLAIRTSISATTGKMPFEIVYGRLPKLPCDLLYPIRIWSSKSTKMDICAS